MIAFDDVVQVMRRRIGDTDTPFTFTDDLLAGYVTDAVMQVEMDWTRGIGVEITIDPDTSVATYAFNGGYVLEGGDVQLLAVKAHYLFTMRVKSQADRDNFRMVKGRLTLDNTNQADDHAETLRLLDKEYKNTLRYLKNGGMSITGVRVE